VAGVLSGLVLIPYLGWGIYTLRLRFRFHEEIAPRTEAITLVLVALFYALETFLLHGYLARLHAYFFFALLGLIVSGAALYGPMAVSLMSHLLVDAIIPAERSTTHEPRYGPAEALERAADYDAALREYLVIARIFPREPAALIRIGELQAKLNRPEEAAHWFERALVHLDSAEQSLQVTNRVCEIYGRILGRPEEAARVLEAYLDRFPEAAYARSVRERIARLKQPAGPQVEPLG
jgi:tetratricopeptide (TPR) repeat protein